MKKFFILLIFTLLIGCDSHEDVVDYSTQEIIINLTEEYPENFIEWKSLLEQQSPSYFVYVFSNDCFYCKEIKTKIINFTKNGCFPIYFIEYTKEIPIAHNINDTLNANSTENIFIKGTPTLMLIQNGVLKLNCAGLSEVNEIIDLYLKINLDIEE